ncbi:MAG: endonuclease/exonuclease/phosphatase family protein [Verrucomicrobiota bacterium]
MNRTSLLGALLLALSLTAKGQTSALPDRDPVTFVSFNVWNYLEMNRRVEGVYTKNAPKPEQEIQPLIQLLSEIKPQILSISEIGTAEDLKDLQTRLAEAGVELPHSHFHTSADRYRRLAILSEFPIIDHDSQGDLTYQIDNLELPFSRGILDVTLRLQSDYLLRVLGVHLKSKREVKEADQELMRLNEARLVRQHVDAILAEAPETNLLVAGDFNAYSNEEPIRTTHGGFGSANYLWAIPLADDRGERWTHHWKWADVYSRLDYAFSNRALYPEIDFETSHIGRNPTSLQGSDHRPLVVYIQPTNREIPSDIPKE